MKKLLLVNPGKPEIATSVFEDMPLSLLYLSGCARSHFEEIKIFDFNILEGEGERTFQEVVEKFKPDVMGITCLFSGHFPLLLSIANMTKKIDHHIHVVVGGMHPTIFARDIIQNCTDIDAVILGEGEIPFIKYLDYLEGRIDADSLEGVVYRREEHVIEKSRKSYADVDTLALPGYEYFDFNAYKTDTSQWYDPKKIGIHPTSASILTSRSCPNVCNFCAMNLVMGKRFRPRSPEIVFQELELLYHKYNVNYFRIVDDNFTFHKSHVLRITDLIIRSGMKIYFETQSGLMLRTLDEEIIDKMIEAGLLIVCLPIESGSDYIRNKIMRKNIDSSAIKNIVKMFRRYPHVIVKAFFMIGMPEDTSETLEETYRLMDEIDVDGFFLSRVTPFPGTPLFEQCVRDKLLVNVNMENMWKYDQLTCVNYDNFFIEPYNMKMDVLEGYDQKMRALIQSKKKWPRV